MIVSFAWAFVVFMLGVLGYLVGRQLLAISAAKQEVELQERREEAKLKEETHDERLAVQKANLARQAAAATARAEIISGTINAQKKAAEDALQHQVAAYDKYLANWNVAHGKRSKPPFTIQEFIGQQEAMFEG